MTDLLEILRFRQQARHMLAKLRSVEHLSDQAIRKLTAEYERDHPGVRLRLFRQRKVAREILAELEAINIERLADNLEQQLARIDLEVTCPDDVTTI